MSPTPQHRVLARRLIQYRSNQVEDSSQPSDVDRDVARLKHPNWEVRKAALEALGNLDPTTLEKHTEAVLGMLDDGSDGSEYVVGVALNTLGKLKPATFAKHVDAVLAKFGDSEFEVRTDAVTTLGKLEPAELAKYALKVKAKLEDEDNDVRLAAVNTMGKLEPATLTQYTQQVIDSLRRVEPDMKGKAWRDYPNLHPFIANLMMGVEGISPDRVRARLNWMNVRELVRAQRLVQQWLAYTWAPGRPGHTRAIQEFVSDFAKRQKVHHSEV